MEYIIHLTDPPYRPVYGEHIRNATFRAVGATYGRFLFTRPVLMEITENVKDVRVKNCNFIGGSVSFMSLADKVRMEVFRYRQLWQIGKAVGWRNLAWLVRLFKK